MSSTSHNRQPAGQPIGGQFAATARAESSVALGAPAPKSPLDAANDQYARKFRRSEEVAVEFLRTNAPEGVTSIEFEWSDQGEYLSLTGFRLADGREADCDGYLTDDCDVRIRGDDELFGDLNSAAGNIEAPYDHGLEDVNHDGRLMRLTITDEDRARKNTPWSAVLASGQEAAAAGREAERVAVATIRGLLPDGVDNVVLICSDQGEYLTPASAWDEDGNEVDLFNENESLWVEIGAAASAIDAEPSAAAREAGLEGWGKDGGGYIRRAPAR